MSRNTLVLRSLSLAIASAATAACAVTADPSAGPLAASSDAPSAGPLAGSGDALVGDPTAWPERVDVRLGAHGGEVCARDDGDTKSAFAAYVASKHGKVTPHPSSDIREWQRENGVPVCRNCDLDGMTIALPGGATALVVDGSARGARFVGGAGPSNLRLENVYARGASIEGPVRIDAKRVDLRCGRLKPLVSSQVTNAEDFDLSGAQAAWVQFTGRASDVRLTGATAAPSLSGAVDGARFDGMENATVDLAKAKVTGTTRFDGAGWINVEIGGTTFAGGKVTAAGAHGYLKTVDGVTATFDGVDLSELDGGLALYTGDGTPAVRTAKGTRWPVGAHGLVADAALPSLDLSGASLVTKDAPWPGATTKLDGLRLSGGALPAGADLSSASLTRARLEGVDFGHVVLSKTAQGRVVAAKLTDANLQLATLGGADVDQVDFSGADLRGASFDSARGAATFTRAQAGTLPAHTGANAGDTRRDTSFRGAVLGASRFDGAQLQYASFASASLADAVFDDAHLDFAKLTGASFFRAGATPDADMANASLARAASLRAVDFSGAYFRKAALGRIDVTPAKDETGAVQRASFAGAFACGADLSGAKLGGANLAGLYFEVDGKVAFPDGKTGTCSGGGRAGASTASTGGVETACPLYGQGPAEAGQCSAAQWRVKGAAPDDECDAATRRKRNGGSCTKACECVSDYCGAQGTCADGPTSP